MHAQTRFSLPANNGNQTVDQYLTVSQASKLLSVHQSTVRRWIDQGRLPAYRVGAKRIAVWQSDLLELPSPRGVHSKEGAVLRVGSAAIPGLTEEEQQQWRRAIDDAKRLQTELLVKIGGKPLMDSTKMINRARDKRTRDVMRDVKG